MKYWCKSKDRNISLYRLNNLFKMNYSFEDIFSKEFDSQMKSYSYYDYRQIEGIVQDYKNIVLIDEIRKGIMITFEGEHINYKSVCLERKVSRGKNFPWIISNFIDDDGLYSHFVLLERLCEMNNFPVPTKNK